MNIFEKVDRSFGAVVARDPIKGQLHVGYTLKELKAMRIRMIGLNDRIVEALESSGIYDLAQLTALTEEELLQIKGLGYGHLLSILRLLRLLNLQLAKK